MDKPRNTMDLKNYLKNYVRQARNCAAAAGALMLLAAPAFCDDPFSMAPPIQTYNNQSYNDGATGNAGADSVFHWSEVPQGQQVPIRRAVFDQGGYQLYDNAGETIVVPFTNQNLYVMKFGQSGNGAMYFVNEGNVPVLYIPRNGSLENAAVPGARWYPFSEDFHPSHPVFLGCAPSWSVFIGMGWYPNMHCHGGYYGESSFLSGGIFLPSFGLFFEIGGRHYDGWDGYHDYYRYHPAPYRVTIVNNYVYDHPYHRDWEGRPFEGSGHPYFGGRPNEAGRPFGGDHSFGGGDHSTYAHRTYGEGVHTFRGANPGGGQSYSGGQSYGGDHSFGAGQTYGNGRHYDANSGGHTFGGGQTYGGDGRSNTPARPAENSNGRPFSGGSRTYNEGGRSYGSSAQPYRGSSNGGGRDSHGSDSRSSGDGGRSTDGGRSYGGGSADHGNGSFGGSYRSR